VTGRQRIRYKQLLDGLKETRANWKLQAVALDHILWRTCVGSTRSHSLENLCWKRLWTCHKTVNYIVVVVVVLLLLLLLMMIIIMYSPDKLMSITRILDGESEVDNVILCLKRCLILLFAVNAEECWQNQFSTLLTLYLIWYKWLWKQFRNWNLSFFLTWYTRTVEIWSMWFTTQKYVTWTPLCIWIEAKDMMHTWLYTHREKHSLQLPSGNSWTQGTTV